VTRDRAGDAFVRNLVAFGRTLRRAGIAVAPEQVADVARALALVGIDDRQRVRRAARALLVKRREDVAPFDLLFDAFWRHPEAAGPEPRRERALPRPDAAQPGRFTIASWAAHRDRMELPGVDVTDRAGTWSDAERMQSKAFSAMTPGELDAVRRLMEALRFEMPERITRRRVADAAGDAIDMRRVLRETARLGAVPARVPRRSRAVKPRPLVLIADISGSMERWSRLVLQFFHAMVRTLPGTETFVFGTRLTRLTPQLRARNIERAIDDAAREVVDWAGGTRIGACLGEFNRRWGRRVLGRGAVVIIVSDGCDRGDPALLARELRHLAHRCHRLVWLNPHLGHAEYAPRVAGMAAALPYIDDFLSVRDLRSLEAFAHTLARLPRARGARGAGRRAAS
jgi:uncharacterized protein with von Willebrand factor type A (vWA) domain